MRDCDPLLDVLVVQGHATAEVDNHCKECDQEENATSVNATLARGTLMLLASVLEQNKSKVFRPQCVIVAANGREKSRRQCQPT